jgi:hypothetical protein
VSDAPTASIRATEAAATALAGAALARVVFAPAGSATAWTAAAVAGANGALSGWRRIYRWRRPDGWLAFGLDSTWAVLTTSSALVSHAAATVRHGRYERSLSERQNRHVYRGGLRLKPRFALTLGNVISNAGDVDGARRRRLVTDHEAVHVRQARALGPLYPVLFGSWAAGGAAVGLLRWLRRGRRDRLGSMIESCAYYCNPLEWWAYSRDANWPPSGKVADVGWRRPAVRSFSSPATAEPLVADS